MHVVSLRLVKRNGGTWLFFSFLRHKLSAGFLRVYALALDLLGGVVSHLDGLADELKDIHCVIAYYNFELLAFPFDSVCQRPFHLL